MPPGRTRTSVRKDKCPVLGKEVEHQRYRRLQHQAHADCGPRELPRPESQRQNKAGEQYQDLDGLDDLEGPVYPRHAREFGLNRDLRTGAQALLKTGDLGIGANQKARAERQLPCPDDDERPGHRSKRTVREPEGRGETGADDSESADQNRAMLLSREVAEEFGCRHGSRNHFLRLDRALLLVLDFALALGLTLGLTRSGSFADPAS